MSSEFMIKCEKKEVRIIDGKSIDKWIEVFASELPSGGQPDIRCMHCHGKIRVHRKHVEHGQEIMLSIFRVKIQKIAEVVIILRESTKCLFSQ